MTTPNKGRKFLPYFYNQEKQMTEEKKLLEEIETDEENLYLMLEFLDDLRESGETNMFGAAPYLVNEFLITKSTARKVLFYWMDTYDKRHPLQ